MRYAVVFDRAKDGTWGAVVPDLPGCLSAGKTVDEARDHVREAIKLWMRTAREIGKPIPPATTVAETIDIA
jgi:predicted RNase H-like HicB family nuclease